MLSLLALNLFISVGFVLVGVTVILKDSNNYMYRMFLGFNLTIAAWLIANYFSNDFNVSIATAQLANHLTLLFPGLVALFLLNFSKILSDGPRLSRRWIFFNIFALCIYLVSLTPIMFTSIQKQGDVYAINFNPFAGVYFATLLINMVLIIYVLLRGRRNAKGKKKDSLNAILWSVSLLIAVNVGTNILLPALGGSFALTNIGPISSIFVVYALWYSIVRHRLFDIRMLITRSVVYIFTLSLIALLFVGGTFALTNLLFKNSANGQTPEWIFTILAVLLAFTFAPIKRFFDRISNRIFYRDSYNSQEFLDQFNKILVATFDLKPLLDKSAQIIYDNIKPTYCAFLVNKTDYFPARLTSVGEKISITSQDNKLLEELTDDSTETVFFADELNDDNKKLKLFLKEKDSTVIAVLNAGGTLEARKIGYLLLGPKKSGNIYSSQDAAVLEIVANELVIAAQNALRFEEIQNFNVTLQQKVDDATRRLRLANEKLKALDETKDDFISMASHQLRTPLTSIKGYLSMVLEGDVGKVGKQQHEMLNLAFTSSQRMVYIIADLLNVSRLKTGKFIIEKSTMYLPDIIDQELDQVEETARSREVKLIFKRPKDFPLVYLDETKTRQVIMNFIDNAIYYTPAGGHVEILLTDTPQSVEFRVKDNGLGVPKADVPHLFTKFYRAGNARKARPDGTGLGLYMAKKVIVTQGGVIIFESTEGKGSTFGFKFAKDKVQLPSGGSVASGADSGGSNKTQPKIAQKTTKATPLAPKKPQKALAKAAK